MIPLWLPFYEVLEDQSKETLSGAFVRLSQAGRASVETVSMGGDWGVYISEVGESIPQVEQKICYDRFHIAQHLN